MVFPPNLNKSNKANANLVKHILKMIFFYNLPYALGNILVWKSVCKHKEIFLLLSIHDFFQMNILKIEKGFKKMKRNLLHAIEIVCSYFYMLY